MKQITSNPGRRLCGRAWTAILVLSFSILAAGCGDRLDLESRAKAATETEPSDKFASLQQQVVSLRQEVESLREQTPQSGPGGGRYQLVPTGKSSLLIDTKVGIAWALVPNPQTKKEYFVPVSFQGGFFVPAVHNDAGELLNPEKEAEAVRSLAEVHRFVKQVEARGAKARAEAIDSDAIAGVTRQASRTKLGKGDGK